jgi:hypothetical protein
MMKSALWMLVALTGCAQQGLEQADVNELAADQVAPPLPQTMVLNLTDPLTPGQPVQIQVTGATPNSQIFLVRSNGQIGAGQCPPQLAGGCLGITPGGSGYQLVPMRTNAAGTAQMNVPLPANLPLGLTLVFQAVDPNGPKGSNTLTRSTASNCTDDGFEQNDTPGAATAGANFPVQANTCPMDEDCFGAIIQPGDVGTFTVTFDDAGDGDVDVTLYDIPGGTILDTSGGTTDLEEVSWFNGTGAPVPVAACMDLYADAGGPVGAIYEVDYASSTPASCQPDALEPNDDSASARARTPGSTPNLSSCFADRWGLVHRPGPGRPDRHRHRQPHVRRG